jgi:predicted acetyltransferase
MKLVLPTIRYKQSYIEALEELKNETGDTILAKPTEGQSFENFVQMLNDNAKGKNLPEGYVPATTFWLIDGDELIGRVQIRHKLNNFLLKTNGHIGYIIRPSKRKMGYGKKILQLGLIEAKKIGLSKALVTCDEDHLASQKIIEANGGILENIIEIEKDKPKTRRYWITIK